MCIDCLFCYIYIHLLLISNDSNTCVDFLFCYMYLFYCYLLKRNNTLFYFVLFYLLLFIEIGPTRGPGGPGGLRARRAGAGARSAELADAGRRNSLAHSESEPRRRRNRLGLVAARRLSYGLIPLKAPHHREQSPTSVDTGPALIVWTEVFVLSDFANIDYLNHKP